MSNNNPNRWNNKGVILCCAGVVLVIVSALIVSSVCTNSYEKIEEKIEEQIEQEHYSEVVEIYNDNIVETDHEEEYRTTILQIIADTFVLWESGDLSYEDAKVTLESFTFIEDVEIADLCKTRLNYMTVEEDGKRLLNEAQTALANGNYAEAFKAIVEVKPIFTQYEIIQALSETCTERTLQSVSRPETEADFRNYIKLLDDCYALAPKACFESRKTQLEKELEIFLEVSEIINRAAELYDQSMVEAALLTLTFGLLDYPNDERLNMSLIDFSDHYIIAITKQANEMCAAEEYNAALDLVEAALDEYECNEFYLLRESIREQKSAIYKFKNNLAKRFEIMAPGWDKESFDVQQVASETGAYIIKSGKKLALGDYSAEDVTILSFGGNIVASLAGVDFLFDLRDVSYDITHWGEEEYFAFYLAADVIALLPVFGVIKYFQHIETVSDGVKAAADVVDSVADVNKASDNAVDIVDAMVDAAKTTDNFADAVDVAKDTTKLGFAAKDIITKVTKGYEPISTINHRYLKSAHPDTGVEFDRAFLKYSDGQKIVGVFPKFNSVADVQLSKDLYKANSFQQEKYCLEQLQKQLKNPFSGTKKNFSDSEVNQILDNKLPDGYTWHHNQKEGFMQLVNREVHESTRHTGGMSLWGAGY